MKKQSAHSCIKDNCLIYGTRDDTGRSLMSQGVPGVPSVPLSQALQGRDNGTAGQQSKNSKTKTSHEQLFVTEI